jgi:penicillin-binding protein 1C
VRWRLTGLAVIAVVLAGAALDRLLPPPLDRFHSRSRVVLDRQGTLLRAFTTPEGSWRLSIRPEEVSRRYLDMLLAAEDRRFLVHPGVDPLAMLRAAAQALRHGRVVSGGSTLTMQVARLLEPRPRTLRAKLIEMARAVQLEARLGKREILQIYLTLAPFGGNLEGIRAATLAWLGKEPDRLSDAEAALLVALPQAPARLAPDAAPERARAARDRVLARAEAAGVLDGPAAAAARASPVPERRRALPRHAPHLAERLAAGTAAEIVRTTVDGDLQARVEQVLRGALARLPAPIDTAAIVLDHVEAEVRARAGSGDYLADSRPGMIDLARAVRSPGSTLKPLVYGVAFDELKAHPASLIRDAPTRFNDFAPGNFDGGFDGRVTVREALRRSLNLPAVTILERVGPVAFAGRLAEAGLDLDYGADHATPGLPLVLGGVGATLEGLVTAYAALAGHGRWRRAAVLADAPPHPARRLIGEHAAAQVESILADVPRPLGFGGDGQRIAFKTGTSYRYRDGWAIGWNARHVIGVWLGRADGAGCAPCNGPSGAAPLLLRLFALLPAAPLPPDRQGTEPAPPALAHIDRGPRALDRNAPRIVFPPDGALVETGGGPLRLEVDGGERPFRWLVDGRPLPSRSWRRTTQWLPAGEGFVTLTVLDALGRANQALVRIGLP